MADRRSFFARLLSSAPGSRRLPGTPTSSPPKPTTTSRRPPPPATTTTAPTTTPPPPATIASTPITAPPLPSATTTSAPNTGPPPPATTTTPQLATIASTTITTTPPPPATTTTTAPSPTTTTSNPTAPPPPLLPATPPPPTTATNAAPITTPATESQSVSQSTANITTTTFPHTPEKQTSANQPTTAPNSPSNSTTSSSSYSYSSSSPSPTTQSPPSSPPQSLSPSHAIPHARSKPSSPSRVGPQTPSTPQRVPQPRSPARSPKQISSNSKIKQHNTSPSKVSTQEILASDDKSPRSQQETKSDFFTTKGTNKPVIESNEKREGPKDVKEIIEATNNKANGETMNEAQSSPKPKIIEKGEIPSVKPTNTTSDQPKKRNTNSNTHNKKSTLPIREHVPLHKDIKEDISTFLNRMATGGPKIAAQERPVSVITLVGENRGASMQMASNSSKTEGSIPIHRSYKLNSDENVEATTTDGEGSSKVKKRKDAEDQPNEAHVNNNAQGINNSIVFNGSITEGNPGVHMVVNHVPKKSTESTEKPSRLDARKAEFNTTRMEKLTYEPTVRRRCLRGLFLETSDSDQENPEKPRRHGCRVGCQQSNKGNNIDVL